MLPAKRIMQSSVKINAFLILHVPAVHWSWSSENVNPGNDRYNRQDHWRVNDYVRRKRLLFKFASNNIAARVKVLVGIAN